MPNPISRVACPPAKAEIGRNVAIGAQPDVDVQTTMTRARSVVRAVCICRIDNGKVYVVEHDAPNLRECLSESSSTISPRSGISTQRSRCCIALPQRFLRRQLTMN